MSIILSTLCLGLTLSAQSGIVNTRPANPQDGKVLTMEETILSRDLTPANLNCTWTADGQFLIHKDGKYRVTKVSEKAFFGKDILYVGIFERINLFPTM